VNGNDPVHAATTATRTGTKLSYCHDPEFVIDLNIAQGRWGKSATTREKMNVAAMKPMHDDNDNL
jgi:hypothetical protein